MIRTAIIASCLCLVASAGHAQGLALAIIGLGAIAQGVQNGEAQRYNMQRGYPAYVSPPIYGQTAPSYFFLNGRTVVCLPVGNFISCQ